MRALRSSADLVVALLPGVSAVAQAQTVEVPHGWTSGGESAALDKVRSAYSAKGGQSVPRDLLEAARIDGVGFLAIFWCVRLPLSLPVFAVAMTLQFTPSGTASCWG